MKDKSKSGNPLKKNDASPKWTAKTTGSGKGSAGVTGGKEYKTYPTKAVDLPSSIPGKYGTTSEDF